MGQHAVRQEKVFIVIDAVIVLGELVKRRLLPSVNYR
jgi:hypothetical protein